VVKELKVKIGDKVAEGSVVLVLEASASSPSPLGEGRAGAGASPSAPTVPPPQAAPSGGGSPMVSSVPAFAGTADLDAGMTYEPYLSAVRAKPEAGKIIATTLDYPMIMDTFGCTPKFLAENPKAAKALADAYFDALAMIKAEPKKSFEIMGADVKQTGEAFEKSQSYLRWQDREANAKFFADEHAAFSKKAAEILLEAGIIKSLPDMSKLVDTRFLK
jgi:NitT/TauT family transport system substrate-binding protein